MASGSFSNAVGYRLHTRDGHHAVLCPTCALSRMRGTEFDAQKEIVCVETIPLQPLFTKTLCTLCGVTPLVITAEEMLAGRSLLEFIERVLRMADREDRKSNGGLIQ